ncbi:hypothetical protein [Roseovarius sp.]|uniref:hypothetical protein n=1 Tax=Roseovarius sp. TaxID=1486281 RepID=UPI0026224A32|nr:hypothetical protein [Roseovarius sp.]MDM8167304.1 hypothetical protein [Roseovarius sp.]
MSPEGPDPAPDLTPTPKPDRTDHIDRAVARAGDATHFVPAESGYLEVPVVELDQRHLVYRADNGRVLSELTDAARARDTPLDTLKSNADTGDIQHLLHDLLIDKARDPGGPIYAELERFGRQTDPLLIREDGTVLNGNRRLASMRQLIATDPDRYGGFSTVRAAVLPEGLTEQEIEFIEAALQMAPDLKLDYGWINRRLKLRQHAADMGPDRVVEAYRFPGPDAIDRELAELALAEDYLDWVGEPGRFQRLAAQEETFTALQAQLASVQQPHLAKIWRRIGFAMVRARDTLDRNILHYFPFTDPVPPVTRNWVPRSLAEDNGIAERQPEGENRPLDKPGANRLLPLVSDPARAENTALAAMALMDTLKGNQDRLLGFTRLHNLLRSANKTLEGMKVDELTEEQRRAIRAQLAAIQQYTGAVTPDDEARYHADPQGPGVRSTVRKTWKRARRLIE